MGTMGISNAEQMLIATVQRQIDGGSTRVVMPLHLVSQASNEVLEELRRLCKLNGVSVEVSQ